MTSLLCQWSDGLPGKRFFAGFLVALFAAFGPIFSAARNPANGTPAQSLKASETAQATERSSPAHQAQVLSPQASEELHARLNALKLKAGNTVLAQLGADAEEFYASFGNSLAWIQLGEPTPQALQVIGVLESAEEKGLHPEDYDGSLWKARLDALRAPNRPSEADLVQFDVALTLAAMRFLSDVCVGRINPKAAHFALGVEDKSLDLPAFLNDRVVNASNPRSAMESAEPQFPEYRRTLDALHVYLKLAREDRGETLPVPSRAIRPGQSYAGARSLATLLKRLGDLSSVKTESQNRYKGDVVEAVKHFQGRHGLEPDGVLDARTFAQLNTPLQRRVEQLELTLERLRWLPSSSSYPPIVVNIPEFRLYIVNDEHHIVSSMNVVVGRAYHHETPLFEGEIQSVIFRPAWNVPIEIVRRELLPQIDKDPGYLEENAYEIVDPDGHSVILDEATAEVVKDDLRAGRLLLRQRPGPENSLGLVKFEFPNPFDVYLHDTPAHELFSKSRRDFSHGCVRVEEPSALAEWVLRDNPEWTPERIRSAMDGNETLRVTPAHPTPVWILYATAVVLEDGQVHFFDDVYGHDAELERALAERATALAY
jgi:murein L,D-transpeptidase YcbB/YkuD